ncbi:GxGYxYP domain-containing protein [Pseudoflavitalea rhizosphaerae]|uniref:GxGYxYP domain-containing protein n=1 Tax=Pseudoflavitalea rhizosphaerae TaxID=1884793 RepID=UPI000F8DA2B7|nr:GxGYxYP domain-containing protein [Pseudoflavitalea rhizosphaerae]
MFIKNILLLAIASSMLTCCYKYNRPSGERPAQDEKKLYNEQFDAFADEGQYWMPKLKPGKNYWLVVDSRSNENNDDNNSLRNHILAESIIGVTALAVNEGRSETMVWTQDPNSNYSEVVKKTGMSHNGNQSTWELIEHHGNVKSFIEGYILCDVNNEESINAATVAAHIHHSIIADVKYEARVKALGYTMKYDATNKTTADAWAEFKDNCNNNALVMMPVMTGNQRGYAIANKLMMVNYNKKYNQPASGNNQALIKDILAWLKPLSPVIGWEQGLEEKTFVDMVSQSGNLMVPFDWAWNATMMSAGYENKQAGLAKVTNPQFIKYDDTKHYASFLLTDGDNVMWMINDFNNSSYYGNPAGAGINMSYGLPVANLGMLSPYQLERLMGAQHQSASLVEYGGGGYYYPDNFGELKNRTELLNMIATKIGSHMRQHRTKVLGLICGDVVSAKSKEAYQAYINNNDQLAGIVAVQYTPYAGGNGEIMWFRNKQGVDIPVITARYSIWNHGAQNHASEGTPAYIASKINSLAAGNEKTHTLTMVHAWSSFKDIGNSTDPLAENNGGDQRGVTPATWCARRLNENVKVVNVEELIWQVRMKYRPEQTKEFLNKYF